MIDLFMAAVIAMAPQSQAPVDTTTVTIEEDESGWDCRTMGNMVCGEGNAQGVPAGDYGDIDNER